ncbi:hypothetical protein DFJ63DRAFT_320802 [Scheffersomyces coipomensis]|uniref:uncharacterized protein n=1 Tax=Scheffersomyces coipomensis TaxID=1788519 RepID=UPI00315D1F5E
MFSRSGTHTPVLSPMNSIHQSPGTPHPLSHSTTVASTNNHYHPHHNRNYNPRHEPVDDTVTWVKDWYSPTLVSSQSKDDDSTASLVDSIKLKGWVKTNLNHKLLNQSSSSSNSNVYNPNDILDLNQWKYYNGVPITDHSRKSSIVDRVLDNDDDEEDDEGSNANNNDEDIEDDEDDTMSFMETDNYIATSKELKSAISFKNDEGHISGL